MEYDKEQEPSNATTMLWQKSVLEQQSPRNCLEQ